MGQRHLFCPHNILLLSQFKNQKTLPPIPFPASLLEVGRAASTRPPFQPGHTGVWPTGPPGLDPLP